MEEERNTCLTISQLIHRALPLTAASSLVEGRPTPVLKIHKNPDHNQHVRKPFLSTCQDFKLTTLVPLNHPTLLIGTLTLPSSTELSSPIKCYCFQFSDGSATICCEVLDFDSKMIGRNIQVLVWNFIPLKFGSNCLKTGFLEIITWDFLEACEGNSCSLSGFSCFCLTLGACDIRDNYRTSGLIFGVIESISPVSIVPCASGGSGSTSISGFLVDVFVCQCRFCVSKSLASKLKYLSEINLKDHCFSKMVIVYLCGLTSSWHPVISRFIGSIVLLTGLEKKLVYIGKEECRLMYVAKDEVSLHICKLFNERDLSHNKGVRGKCESGSYIGVVTGLYMHGMVVELDQNVVLLLTNQYLIVPHCVRVGAIVTVKNVHFVDPNFPWGKMLILGSCCKTSMHVESFSPLETGCHVKSYSPSVLQKFIDSLSFAARLWALLVVSCFRKKFVGILSEKEILGSKHQGIMLEFCKHDLCYGEKEAHYGHLRLVLPISNLFSYCEASWKKILDDQDNFSNFFGCTTSKKYLCCDGRTHVQSLRRVLNSEEVGIIIVGKLKVSLSSGRLQIVDATGEVDIMIDVPATWDFDKIFEARNFRLIIEGVPPKLVDLSSTIYQPLSCRSIFSNAPALRKMKLSVFLEHCPTDEDSSTSLFFDRREHSQELESGNFHLLMLTHKFPAQKNFQRVLGKRTNTFAQAIILPWDLLIDGKNRDMLMPREKFIRPGNHFTHKKLKIEQTSVENGLSDQLSASGSSYYSNSYTEHSCVPNFPLELPCLIESKGVNCHYTGTLRCTDQNAKNVCCCKLPRMEVLLEFGVNSFCKYEALKIGRCYLVRHQEGDTLCSIKRNYQVSRAKVCIDSATHLRSFTFLSIESLQNSDAFPFCDGIDITVFVPSSSLNFLKNVTKILDNSNFKDHDHIGSVIKSSENSYSDYTLPEGNLITLSGLILGLHDCNDGAFPGQPRKSTLGEGYFPIYYPENDGAVCVHVMVDTKMVRIVCDRSKQSYPIGLARDAHATFHRILVLSGLNMYMVTPASFITINDTSLMNEHLTDKDNDVCKNVGLNSVLTPTVIPTTLISDALRLSQPKLLQFRCRVVGVYTLVLEKARTNAFCDSSVLSIPSALGILLAGFVMDDGSSSCCFWADSERAAALLGLQSEDYLLKDCGETFQRSKTGGTGSTSSQLIRMLDKHGRIVVKNFGSVFDSSCQDLAFSVDSDSRIISSPDENILRCLVANAIFSTSWTINGSLMDSKSFSWLEERLTELDMAVPQLLNIWVTRVCRADVLAEARDIIQGLV